MRPRSRRRWRLAVVVVALLAGAVVGCGTEPTGPTSQQAGSSPAPSPTASTAPTPTAAAPSPAATTAPRPLPLVGVVVALDPGHNRDNGSAPQTRELVDAGGLAKPCNSTGTASADARTESRFTFELAQRVAAALRALGADVRTTRDRDAGWGPCVDDRGRFGAEVGAALLLSLHADGSTRPGDRGFHVIRPALRTGWTDDIAASSARLATAVRDELVAAGFAPSNYRGEAGIDVRDDLGTLNWADVPAVVVETHNMRDAADAALFGSPAGQDRAAHALARAVQEHLAA